jgi:hypothetical protein
VLKVLPLHRVVMVVRQKVDRRCYPANPPLSSWRDQSFLRALAEEFCRAFAIPGLVREWGNAGKAPAPKTQSSPPAGEMPDDIDEPPRPGICPARAAQPSRRCCHGDAGAGQSR